MKNENYVVIQGWMVNDLGLKGDELLVYAIIYGFTQDGQSEYDGSLNYLASTIGRSKPTVIKVIKSLKEKELITCRQVEMNNVIFNKYKAVPRGSKDSLPLVKDVNGGSKDSLLGGSKNSLPNNNIYINNNKNNIYSSVTEYLNSKAGTKYKPTSGKTKRLIDARVNEGFSLEDFQTVIDKKVSEWKGTEWEKFLRPETLFGNKFEGYLNATINKPKKNTATKWQLENERTVDYDNLQRQLGGF